MKLNARDAARFCEAPDLRYKALLIYGEDSTEVTRRRKEALTAIIGDDGDHGVTQLDVGEARRKPGVIADAMRARGFFGGEPVVIIENGTDGLAAGLSDVLDQAEPDDGFVIVTAGILPARSKLRKLFEGSSSAVAAPCYVTAVDRMEIEKALAKAGIQSVDEDAIRDLVAFAQTVDRGALADLIGRLSLYKLSDENPLSSDDVVMCVPGSGDVAIDDLLDAVTDGAAAKIGSLMNRLEAQGFNPTTVIISATRKFRQLHMLSAADGSIDAAISRMRPPVFGPRRDTMMRQARTWSVHKCEAALRDLLATDSDLRGGAEAAGFALLERSLLRLALNAKR